MIFDVGTAIDYTGNSTVTLHNNPTLDADGLNLDRASSQYADLGTTNIGDDYTISVWANTHTSSDWQRVVEFRNGQADDNININEYYATGQVSAEVRDDSTVFLRHFEGANATFTLNEWQLLTFVSSKSTQYYYLYVNGKQQYQKMKQIFQILCTVQIENKFLYRWF